MEALETTMTTGDIIDLILEDHKALKRLIAILKDSDIEMAERYIAFEEFAPLLIIHAKPEEKTLYVEMKKFKELRWEGMEGEVEHSLAEQLLNEAQKTEDDDLWMAKVKVLAELVEHHIKEEEKELLPDFKKHCDEPTRLRLGDQFIKFKKIIGKEHPILSGQKLPDDEKRSPPLMH